MCNKELEPDWCRPDDHGSYFYDEGNGHIMGFINREQFCEFNPAKTSCPCECEGKLLDGYMQLPIYFYTNIKWLLRKLILY